MRKRFVLAAIIFVAAATIHADSPFAGTWRLNVAKSIGPNQPKELIAVVTEKGDQIETVMKGIAAEGRPISIRYTSSIKGGVVKFLEGRLQQTSRSR